MTRSDSHKSIHKIPLLPSEDRFGSVVGEEETAVLEGGMSNAEINGKR